MFLVVSMKKLYLYTGGDLTQKNISTLKLNISPAIFLNFRYNFPTDANTRVFRSLSVF